MYTAASGERRTRMRGTRDERDLGTVDQFVRAASHVTEYLYAGQYLWESRCCVPTSPKEGDMRHP